jgi:hypothetical protein
LTLSPSDLVGDIAIRTEFHVSVAFQAYDRIHAEVEAIRYGALAPFGRGSTALQGLPAFGKVASCSYGHGPFWHDGYIRCNWF